MQKKEGGALIDYNIQPAYLAGVYKDIAEVMAYFCDFAEELKKKYSIVYLVRNELQFHLYSFNGGERKPDYVLFLQSKTEDGYEQMQIFIEPKGDHLMEQDKWKEEFLLQIEEQSVPVKTFVDDKKYRIWGFHFFNQNMRSLEFDCDFQRILKSDSNYYVGTMPTSMVADDNNSYDIKKKTD